MFESGISLNPLHYANAIVAPAGLHAHLHARLAFSQSDIRFSLLAGKVHSASLTVPE
jgi:hypothetical protein